MKYAFLLIAIALFTATAETRYITFTDSERVEQRHELASDTAVRTYRPDGER